MKPLSQTCALCGNEIACDKIFVALRSFFFRGKEYPTTPSEAAFLKRVLAAAPEPWYGYEKMKDAKGNNTIYATARRLNVILEKQKLPFHIRGRYKKGYDIVWRKE